MLLLERLCIASGREGELIKLIANTTWDVLMDVLYRSAKVRSAVLICAIIFGNRFNSGDLYELR
jgi:hypothetical protein